MTIEQKISQRIQNVRESALDRACENWQERRRWMVYVLTILEEIIAANKPFEILTGGDFAKENEKFSKIPRKK